MARFQPRGRHYKTPNYRDLNSGKVSVDTSGRVFLFDHDEVGGIELESRFHFFEAEIDATDWPRVRARYGLVEKMRRTCYSHGVRRGEGRQAGLGRYPKRPIHEILEERDCASGETSFKVNYGEIERLVKKDLASGLIEVGGDQVAFDMDDSEIPF